MIATQCRRATKQGVPEGNLGGLGQRRVNDQVTVESRREAAQQSTENARTD